MHNNGVTTMPAPIAGALWMTAAAGLFGVLNLLIRWCADAGLHPFQISFLRSFFAVVIMVPTS